MKITIDNRELIADQGTTLLEVARRNDIYIPSLCAHPDLSPYGGCRLCIVEVKGRPGYPTACTTFAEEGMEVRTDTRALRELRTELIQLILSEHPAACLMCGEVEGCTGFQDTIRKAGVTTGCRWCPKDKDCEFQRIVEDLDIHDLTLPGLYRNIPLEKYDPFFDRDYNLCIYCDRCVRICNEYRKSSVLSLRQRGKFTTIGPSYNNNHIDADCEFCGACVSVCPTGAMSEKSRKWWGAPDRYLPSVCPLCSLTCDIQVLTLKNKIVGTVPPGKPHEAGGSLCVKGRFCLSELLNRTDRLLEPMYKYPEGYGYIKWDTAIEKAVEVIRSLKPERSAMFLSPGLSLEEYSLAGVFAEKILKTTGITSSCLNGPLAAFMELAEDSVNFDQTADSDFIASFFLAGNYSYAPLTMAIKSAADHGIPYYQLGWIKDTTSRFARQRIIPSTADIPAYLGQLAAYLENGKRPDGALGEFCKALSKSRKPVIILGPEILSLTRCESLLDKIRSIATLSNSRLIMPNPYGNLKGMLSILRLHAVEEITARIGKGKIDLLYLVGDAPLKGIEKVKHIIFQGSFPSGEGLQADLVLPSALWGETSGSYLGTDQKIKHSPEAAAPHGYARPHSDIFRTIALKAGSNFPKTAKIKANARLKADLSHADPPHQKQKTATRTTSDKKYPYLLIQEKSQHVFHNLNLSLGIEGFAELVQIERMMINPLDARALGLKKGDIIGIKSHEKENTYRVTIKKNVPQGFFHLILADGNNGFEANPCPVNIRRVNV